MRTACGDKREVAIVRGERSLIVERRIISEAREAGAIDPDAVQIGLPEAVAFGSEDNPFSIW